MASDFNDLALIPHTQIIQAAVVSDTHGNKRFKECLDEGIIKEPRRTVTGRTFLTPSDGRSFYEALISVR